MNKREAMINDMTAVGVYYAEAMYNEVRDWIGVPFSNFPQYDSQYRRDYPLRREALDVFLEKEESYLTLLHLPKDIDERLNVLNIVLEMLGVCTDTDYLLEFNISKDHANLVEDLHFYIGQMVWALESVKLMGEVLEIPVDVMNRTIEDLV